MSKLYSVMMGWMFILSFIVGGCIHDDQIVQPQPTGEVSPDTATRSRPAAEIKSGSYRRVNFKGALPETIALNVIGMEVDRENQQAVFKLRDGSQVAASWSDTNAVRWGQGCPDNFGSVRMEMIYLEIDELVLDGVTFEHPLLVATCPAPPTVIVLRESYGISDVLPAVACNGWEGAKCVYLAQDYITLYGQIVDIETDDMIQDADIKFSSPAGQQSFSGTFRLSLPGDAVVDFTIRAPGFQDASGQIEILSNTVMVSFESGIYAGEPPRIHWVSDPDEPIEWNFALALDFSFDDSRAACQASAECLLMKVGVCDTVQAIHLSQIEIAQAYSERSKKEYPIVQCAPGWPIEYYEPLCLNLKCRAIQKDYRMLLEVPEQPVAGRPFWVGMSFRIPTTVEEMNAHFNLPDGIKIIGGEASWIGRVEANRDYVLWVELLAETPGQVYLTGWAKAQDNPALPTLSSSEHVEVVSPHSLTPWPERERILATPTPVKQ